MQWKQFFTPVDSIDAQQGKKIMAETPASDIIILDVRQPKEYEASHLPGARLVPLPELTSRLSELDPEKPILVY